MQHHPAPYIDADSLKETYAAHTEQANDLTLALEGALGSPLTETDVGVVEDYVLCTTFHRVRGLAQQVRSELNAESARAKISEMAAYNSESRDHLIATIQKAYRPWGVDIEPVSFSSLLAWESALVEVLP